MLKLVDSLDRVLSFHPLQAIVPKFAYNGHKIKWDESEGSGMNCHRDIEERFHWVYGPYLMPSYYEHFIFMLKTIVDFANSGTGASNWFMCSVVRMKIAFYQFEQYPELCIEVIFVRPCLQKKGIFGQILKYFAENLNDNITFSIHQCFPESQQAMDSKYNGRNEDIFVRTENLARGTDSSDSIVHSVSYKLNGKTGSRISESKNKFLKPLTPFNAYQQTTANFLNGLNWEEIDTTEQSWAEIAVINAELNIQSTLISMQFQIGFESEEKNSAALNETVSRLRNAKIHTGSLGDIGESRLEMIETMETLLKEFNFNALISDSGVYVADENLIQEYSTKISSLQDNLFYKSLQVQPRTRVKHKLFSSYRCIKSMQTILEHKKVDVNTQHTHFPISKVYSDLAGNEKRYINHTAINYPAIAYILRIPGVSDTMKLNTTRNPSIPSIGHLEFQFDDTYTHEIESFVSTSTEVLRLLEPLISHQ